MVEETSMPTHRLREALIDVQTIVIVGLLYWLLREEQSNPFLRTWLSNNFSLGLYILSPLIVAAISGTLLIITATRVILFVMDRNVASESRGVRRLNVLREQLREFALTRGAILSALVLTGSGILLTLYSYLVGVVPLAALGISCIILSFTAISLSGNAGGGLGMRAMLQGATLSIEALLEQCNAGRATYLPPHDGGAISAYVPLSPEAEIVSLNEMRQAPKSMISNNQKGVLVYPVGSELGKIPEFQDGLSLEERLRYVLVELASLCSQVMAEETGSLVIVGMKRPDGDIQGQRYLGSLGTLPSSLAACVIVGMYNKPVTLLEERKAGDRLTAVFRMLV
jgi:hypothetical protein